MSNSIRSGGRISQKLTPRGPDKGNTKYKPFENYTNSLKKIHLSVYFEECSLRFFLSYWKQVCFQFFVLRTFQLHRRNWEQTNDHRKAVSEVYCTLLPQTFETVETPLRLCEFLQRVNGKGRMAEPISLTLYTPWNMWFLFYRSRRDESQPIRWSPRGFRFETFELTGP